MKKPPKIKQPHRMETRKKTASATPKNKNPKDQTQHILNEAYLHLKEYVFYLDNLNVKEMTTTVFMNDCYKQHYKVSIILIKE